MNDSLTDSLSNMDPRDASASKKATNGLKRDKNGLILCNVSLMEVLAPFFGIKKTLPPLLQKLYDGDGILRYSSIRSIFSLSQEAHKAELRLRLYAPRLFYTSLLHWPSSNAHAHTKRCNQLNYISQAEINIWDRGVLWRILLWQRVAWGAKFF